MKLPLFRAALKNQWLSMTIYCVVLFLYGLLIMLAFTSVKDTVNDPMASADGIELTEMGKDNNGTQMFNLSWGTATGVAYHTAVGVSSMEALEPFMTEENAERLSSGNLSLDELEGVTVLYNGTGDYVHFTNTNGSTMFAVVLYPLSGEPTDLKVRGPIYTEDLEQTSDFDEYLEDNAFMEGLFGSADIKFYELEGFIVLEYFSMWPIFLVIYLGMKTVSSVSKHVEDRSLDILLATGYSRSRFLTEKSLVVVVNTVLVFLSAWVGVILGSYMVGETSVPITGITIVFLGSVPMAIAFVGICLIASVLINEGGKAVGAALGIIIFQYVIQIVANIASWGDKLAYFTLFGYWDSFHLMSHHELDAVDVAVPLTVGVISIALAYYLFKKKEIYA